jgi:hypothetical protein
MDGFHIVIAQHVQIVSGMFMYLISTGTEVQYLNTARHDVTFFSIFKTLVF